MDKMHKIDSFIRETQRVDIQAIRSSARQRLICKKKTTLLLTNVSESVPCRSRSGIISPRPSNFHVLQRHDCPCRYTCVAPTPCGLCHEDGEMCPDPRIFDGFRFSKLREQEGDFTVAKRPSNI